VAGHVPEQPRAFADGGVLGERDEDDFLTLGIGALADERCRFVWLLSVRELVDALVRLPEDRIVSPDPFGAQGKAVHVRDSVQVAGADQNRDGLCQP